MSRTLLSQTMRKIIGLSLSEIGIISEAFAVLKSFGGALSSITGESLKEGEGL